MSSFEERNIAPMLIVSQTSAFDDDNYIYELKLDGVRCLAYITKNGVDLYNKRALKLNAKFPELKHIHKQVKAECVLDGELYVYQNGKTDFFEIQRRTLTSDPFKIRLLSTKLPATFTAFDILYYKGDYLYDMPLMKRKDILSKIIKETPQINISRYIEKNGIQLFELTKQQGLEGIVAKRKDSKYHIGKRTKDWIKCKNLLDDDYVICGYIVKDRGVVSLVLAQYNNEGVVCYKGHVTMGASLPYLQQHSKKTNMSLFTTIPKGNEDAVWITPPLVGTVAFMEYTENGGLRQPIFKGFREDKLPLECTIKEEV